MRGPVAVAPDAYLRRATVGDADEFCRRVAASTGLHDGYVFPATDAGEFRQWLARGDRPDCEQFLVCRRSDDAIAGFTNLNNIILGSLRQAFASWAAFAGLEGQGLMTQGVDAALRVAFTTLRLHRVEANIQPGNERSRALAVRCGFRLEGYSPQYLRIGGEWRDHERWALLEPEWRANSARAGRRGDD